jgi:hypothetical protein
MGDSAQSVASSPSGRYKPVADTFLSAVPDDLQAAKSNKSKANRSFILN